MTDNETTVEEPTNEIYQVDWKPEVVVPGPNALIQLAIDRGFDIDRLRQLIDLRDRAEAKVAEKAFTVAFNAAQGELKIIVKDAENKQKKVSFARLEAVNKVVVPCIVKHGFTISCSERPSNVDSPVLPDCRRFVVVLSHIGGHSKTFVGDVPIDGKGAKGGDVMTNTQGWVSTGSYAQRVIICRALNLTIADSDKDGELEDAMLSEDQQIILNHLIEQCETACDPVNMTRFLAMFKVGPEGQISDIKQKHFESAKQGFKTEVVEEIGGGAMRSGFDRAQEQYDNMTPDDDEEKSERRRQRDEYLADRADYEHDRIKDERAERESIAKLITGVCQTMREKMDRKEIEKTVFDALKEKHGLICWQDRGWEEGDIFSIFVSDGERFVPMCITEAFMNDPAAVGRIAIEAKEAFESYGTSPSEPDSDEEAHYRSMPDDE